MRVNPNPMPDLLAALARTQKDEAGAMIEIATGRRVNKPSDDPNAAALLVHNQDRLTIASQYLKTMSAMRGQLQTADTALNSVVLALERAISLGVQGASDPLSVGNRASIAEELAGIQSHLVSLANVSFQGQYLFAGTATHTRPFTEDATSASGVRYDGNDGVNAVQVGDGFLLPVNRAGSQLFDSPGSGVFQAMNDLIQSLQNGIGVDAAVVQVREALDHVSAQRVFYGNAMNQVDSQQTFLNSQKLELSSEENNLAGADLSESVSRLLNAQNASDATLGAVARIARTSLFDYL